MTKGKRSVQPDGDAIRRLREEHGWSRADLAEIADVGERVIDNAEVGKPIRLQALSSIASAFNVDNREILEMPAPRSTSAASSVDSEQPAVAGFPAFRDILLKRWQEIPIEERPRPVPPVPATSYFPFPLKPRGEIDYVEGWHVRLRSNLRYRLAFTFCSNDLWPEIEIVLYQRLLANDHSVGVWKRVVSAGAITSGEAASEVTPQSDDWLITCWGKTVVAWDAPWWAFVPETSDLDVAGTALTLSFSSPTDTHPDRRPSTSPARAGSRATLLMQAAG